MDNLISAIPNHAIAALATPRYKSALAIIRITGDDCIPLFTPFVKEGASLSSWNANHTRYCVLEDPSSHVLLDEVMLTIFHAPHSYTGQDSIEISLHGSPVGIDKILNSLYTHGFEPANPGEFTQRAFLNGKIDLTQAEAIHALIESHTQESHTIALQQLGGAVSQYIHNIKTRLMHIAAICTVSLDYPEDEIQESTDIDPTLIHTLIDDITQTIKGYDVSQLYKDGAMLVLIGRTNAGKSSLFNTLLKEERAIISNTPGTTRDFLESRLSLHGIPLHIYDTAGLRKECNDAIEKEGIQRTLALVQKADIVLYVADISHELTEDFITIKSILNDTPSLLSRMLIILNKIDLAQNHPYSIPADIPLSQNVIIEISATHFINIASLQEKIYHIIEKETLSLHRNDVIISSLRQKQQLEQCRAFLIHTRESLQQNLPYDIISLDIDSALRALGNIVGEISTEDILEVVFQNFCLGK